MHDDKGWRPSLLERVDARILSIPISRLPSIPRMTAARIAALLTNPRWPIILLAGIWIFLPTGRCKAQMPPDLPRTWVDRSSHLVRHWTTADGLPVNFIYHVVQLEDGRLAMATAGGLVFFDGWRFRVRNRASDPGLRSSNFGSITPLDGARLLAHTVDSDVVLFDGRGFRTVLSRDQVPPRIVSGAVSGDTLWLRDGSAVVSVVGDKLEYARGVAQLPPPSVLRRLAVPGSDSWLLAISDSTALRIDVGIPTAVIPVFAELRGMMTLGPKEGRIWLPVGISREGPTLHTDIVPVGDDVSTGYMRIVPGTTIPSVLVQHHNQTVVHSAGSSWTVIDRMARTGMVRPMDDFSWLTRGGSVCALTGGSLTCFDLREMLGDVLFTSLALDDAGALWVGTDRGLFQIARRKVEQVDVSIDGRGRMVRAAVPLPDGRVAMGTWGAGITLRSTDGTISRIDGRNGLPSELVWTLTWDGARLWAGTNQGGFGYWDEQEMRFKLVSRGSTRAALSTRSGVWYSSQPDDDRTYLYRLRGHVTDQIDVGPQERDFVVKGLTEDRSGRVWISTTSGLYSWSEGNPTTRYGEQEGLPQDHVVMTYEDHEGLLWVSTHSGGLALLHEGRVLGVVDSRAGLPSDGIWAIVEDETERFWMSSDYGVFVADRASILAVARGAAARMPILRYSEDDGMPSAECNGAQPAAMRAFDGRIWFPTIDGFAVFEPYARDAAHRPNVPIAWDFLGAGVPVDMDSLTAIPRGVASVSIEYSVINLTDPNHSRARYRLRGQNDAWTSAAGAGNARFNDLRPGTYVFELTAADAAGRWSGPVLELPFVLRPRWSEAWWFRLPFALVLLGGVLGLVRYRERFVGLREREQARRRIAQDLHDDLGSRIGTVRLLLEMFNRSSSLGPEERHLVDKAVENMNRLGSEFRDSLWLVDVDDSTISGLVSRMRQFADQLPLDAEMSFEAEVDEPERLLGLENRRNLYYLFREALHNAAKHAKAGRIGIAVIQRGSEFRLDVIDDGVGFEPHVRSNGWGLRSMRWRADAVHGCLDVSSTPGEGTRLTLIAQLDREGDGR